MLSRCFKRASWAVDHHPAGRRGYMSQAASVWCCIRSRKNYQYSTEGQKRHQNLAPVANAYRRKQELTPPPFGQGPLDRGGFQFGGPSRFGLGHPDLSFWPPRVSSRVSGIFLIGSIMCKWTRPFWGTDCPRHHQVTDLDVTVLGFSGPGLRSARQLLCGDAPRLFSIILVCI